MICAFSCLAQSPEFVLPPNKLKLLPSPSISSLAGAGGNQHTGANGAFDSSGNLLFYVQDHSVISAAGNSMGYLANLTGPFYSCTTSTPEIHIVPIPNQSCRKFYIIYTLLGGQTGNGFGFAIVDCSSATPTLTQSGTFVDENPGNQCPIAIGPLRSDHTRFLYYLTNTSLNRYTITNAGIGQKTVVFDSSTQPSVEYRSNEMEMSTGGNKLAWGDTQLNVATLNSSGLLITVISPVITGASVIYGLEWNSGGNKVFMSTYPGIKVFTPSNSSLVSIPNTANYNYAYPEMGIDGFIYVSNNAGTALGKINTSNNTISTGPTITLFGNGNYGGGQCFSMPKQLDFDINIAGPDKSVVSNCCANSNTTTIGYTATTGCTYSWTPTTGVASPTSSLTSVTTSITRTYTLTRTSSCGAITDKVTVFAGAATQECCSPPGGFANPTGNSITAYPNPTSASFKIEHNMPSSIISIYDQFGKKCLTQTAGDSETITEINAEALSKGVYLIQVISIEKSSVGKIIID